MRIRVVATGKIKEKYLQEGIADYVERCRRYLPFEIVETKEEREPVHPCGKTLLDLKRREGEYLEARIRGGDFVVALDPGGQKVDSVRFARLVQKAFDGGSPQVTFVVGGSNGLHESIVKRANATVSFSDMTFPHQLFRLILCEQCFRALTILKGQTYHK